MNGLEEKISNRMRKIGTKKSFTTESQALELEENKELVKVVQKAESGITVIDLILEPNKFDELSSETRLSFEEFCDAINDFIEDEEDDWKTLRMKDQVNMTRDKIIEETIIKHAKEVLKIQVDLASGREISYSKRYDEQGTYLGESITVSLTMMPGVAIG